MSTLPNAASVASRSASSVSRLVTSAVSRSVLRPAASIASAVSATSAARRAAATTSRLIARPMPVVPPRTTAVRPSRFNAEAGPATATCLPPHGGRQRDHVLVGQEGDVLHRRIADANQRVGAVEPVRVLDDDL